MKHIGIYPGTFDPLHEGHIAFALSAIERCQLDSVVFMPEELPRGKHDAVPIDERAAHIEYSIQSNHKLRMYRSNSARFSVNETLHELTTTFANSTLTLLVGSDVAVRIHLWPEISRLMKICHLAIGLRDGETISEIERALDKLAAITSQPNNYSFITTPYAGVTSSQLRLQK
jgi:nicotinate-nucleotide adenylyltransferase